MGCRQKTLPLSSYQARRARTGCDSRHCIGRLHTECAVLPVRRAALHQGKHNQPHNVAGPLGLSCNYQHLERCTHPLQAMRIDPASMLPATGPPEGSCVGLGSLCIRSDPADHCTCQLRKHGNLQHSQCCESQHHKPLVPCCPQGTSIHLNRVSASHDPAYGCPDRTDDTHGPQGRNTQY